jgi:threonine/homoserine/homoserine lactone efflux protein
LLISQKISNFASAMWLEPVNIIDIIVKGMLIGIFASAPMGPVGVLCIQRTLNKGRWYGFATGVGAAASDIIYALITGFGISFVMDFVNNERNLFVLKIVGSVMLLLFGVYCYMSKPKKNLHPASNKKGTLVHNGVTAFWITFSNPLIIFIFMAAFAQFAFVRPDYPFEMVLGYLSIILGALLWWFGLSWLIDKVRGRFDNNGIKIINRTIGIVVIIASLIVLIGTVTNLYSLSY